MKKKYLNLTRIMAIVLLFSSSCAERYEYSLPEAKTNLQNDAIFRSMGPHIVGLNLYFVYAMALGFDKGTLVSAQVEASIAGAPGTYLENKSYFTNTGGIDQGIVVADPSVTNGNITEVSFTKDTCAAALRYYYIIPEEARGKTVSFTFSAIASTGETVSYKLGPYTIAKMDMKLDITMSDNNLLYFSIADMKAYNAAEAAANAGNIDLVYLHRSITGILFGHALVAPAANAEYLPGITLPAGVNKNTKIQKMFALRDRHLARDRWGEFVDDIDFEKLNISGAPNYSINLLAEYGLWVETEDGKYRAYIYVNAINNTAKTMRISLKRYTM